MTPAQLGIHTRRVTVRPIEGAALIEVDGRVDAVTAYDLRHVLEDAFRSPIEIIRLDLSRVTEADDHGIAALSWCSHEAISAHRTRCGRGVVVPCAMRCKATEGASVLAPQIRRPGSANGVELVKPAGRADVAADGG